MRLTLFMCLTLLAVGCRPPESVTTQAKATATGPSASSAKTYTRKEFEGLVMGKTPDAVLAAVGKPRSTSGEGGDMWSYGSVTTDPVTGKTDLLTFVHYEGGRVATVRY